MSPQKETNQTRDNQNAAAHSESGNVTAPALAVLSPPPLQLSAVPTEKKEEPDSIEQEVFAGKSFSSGPSMPAEQPSTPPSLGNNSENKDKSITPFQLKKTGGIIQKKETLPFQKKSNQSSSSSSLPEDTRGKMENAFKTDFSNVNIHTNSQSATDVGALAYTQGNDVHFAPGQFKPNTQSGQELIGHELTHVVQQRAGKVQPTTNVGGMPVNDSKGLENEADNMGRKAAQFRLNPSSPVEKNTSNPIASSTIQRQEDTAAQTQNTSLAATPVQSTHQSPAPVSGNATALVENAPQAQEGNATTAPKGGQKSEESKGSKAPAPAQTQENIAPASKKAGKAAKSTSSKTDAAFEGEKEKITLKATEQKEHEPTEKKVIDTQKAAKAPANEVQSLAQEKQVGKMNEQQPGEFNAAAFEEKLLARVEAFAPNNLDETTKFKSSGKTKNLKNTVSTDVQTAKKETKEDIEVTTKEAPDTSSVTAKEVVAMPSPEKAPEKGSIDSVKAAPKAKPTAVVSQPLQENSESLDQQMAAENLTDQQLIKSNEPSFQDAVASKRAAQAHSKSAPLAYRGQEEGIINQAQAFAGSTADMSMGEFSQVRLDQLSLIQAQQSETQGKDEAKRQEISAQLESIYQNTKIGTEAILTTLDTEVNTMFDISANYAASMFEDYVDRRMKAYKKERYSGVIGKGRWFKDLFMDLPSEVNEFYEQGKKDYIKDMKSTITKIANHVAAKLNEAKALIATGRQEAANYLSSLDPALRELAGEAAESIMGKFDTLEQTVDDKEGQLIESLAQSFSEKAKELDARIEELQAANRGLINQAIDKVKGVIETIRELKDMLMNVLSGAVSLISAIIKDPIGVFQNLVSGVKQGLNNFMTNIGDHLQTGLMDWLFGTLGEAGIEMPATFGLKGIFSIITQVLGLTWDHISEKIGERVGEENMERLEESVGFIKTLKEEGIGGLMSMIGDKLTEIKETVLGSIKDFIATKIIKAGVMWLVSLFNPVAAFIKACKGIYNLVMFFIERGSQIMALVQSIIGSMSAIVSGNVVALAGAIENTLAKGVPVAIGFLARLLGMGGISGKIKAVIKKIRKPVDKAINWVLDKGEDALLKLGLIDKKTDKRSTKPEDERWGACVASLKKVEAKSLNNPKSEKVIHEIISGLKAKHRLDSISVNLSAGNWIITASLDENKATFKVKAPSEEISKGEIKAEENVNAEERTDEKQAKVEAGLADLQVRERKFMEDGRISLSSAKNVANNVKQKHKVFKSFRVVDGGDTWDYRYAASPERLTRGEKKLENLGEKGKDKDKFELNKDNNNSNKEKSSPNTLGDYEKSREQIEKIKAEEKIDRAKDDKEAEELLAELGGSDERTPQQKKADLNTALLQGDQLLKAKKSPEDIKKELPNIKKKNNLQWIRLVDEGENFHSIEAKVNPEDKTAKYQLTLPEENEKNIELTIASDKQANMMSKEYLEDAHVGHSWIMIKYPNYTQGSYGFYPANLGEGGGFDASRPWKSVAGEVISPDEEHTPTAKLTNKVSQENITKGIKYASANKNKNYNLLTYNCTHFAREFYKKSGLSAPPASIVANPNALHNSIEAKNKRKQKDALENNMPSNKSK